ncbi:MAG: hypothetical protein R3F43_22465 [bacterium]
MALYAGPTLAGGRARRRPEAVRADVPAGPRRGGLGLGEVPRALRIAERVSEVGLTAPTTNAPCSQPSCTARPWRPRANLARPSACGRPARPDRRRLAGRVTRIALARDIAARRSDFTQARRAFPARHLPACRRRRRGEAAGRWALGDWA